MKAPAIILLSMIIGRVLTAQSVAQRGVQPEQQSAPALPVVKLVFSEPKLDSPVPLPYMAMDAPLCGPDARSFIQFMTPPPYYNQRVVYSISHGGQIVHFRVENIPGLTHIAVKSIDPGVSRLVILLTANDTVERAPTSWYVALFDYGGELRRNTKLDLSFEPVKVAQLYDDGFVVLGADRQKGQARMVLVDSMGSILREMGPSLMPSKQGLSTMLASFNFAGMKPKDMSPELQTSAVLSLSRPLHSGEELLILQPGAGARVIEILPSGETRNVNLKLPPSQVADSMMVGNGVWYVRTFPAGGQTVTSLYQVDPETGEATKQIDTLGVPVTTIVCPDDSGFYGFRWIDHKMYLIQGQLQ